MEEELREDVGGGQKGRCREKGDCFAQCHISAASECIIQMGHNYCLVYLYDNVLMHELSTVTEESCRNSLQTVVDSTNPAADFLMHVNSAQDV